MADVITVENFQHKLPQWDPQSGSSPLFALVDMGRQVVDGRVLRAVLLTRRSNGIRFSISDLSAPYSRLLRCIYASRAAISLYDALNSSATHDRFPATTIVAVAQTLARFRAISDAHGVPADHIQVFATEATRRAANRAELLAAIRDASGLEVQILSPQMESLFGAMGARSSFGDEVHGVFLDLGGGSVQMTYVDTRSGSGVAAADSGDDYPVKAAIAATSMPFGAARLSATMNASTTAATTAMSDLGLAMRQSYQGLEQLYPHLKQMASCTGEDGLTVYLCGGGFRGYGSMLQYLHQDPAYPIPEIGGFVARRAEFYDWQKALQENDAAEKQKIYGLSKRRRAQFPAIVAVIKALTEAVPHIQRVVFCKGGNREGVLFMKLPRHIRESDPLQALIAAPPGLFTPNAFGSMSKTAVDALVQTLETLAPRLPFFETIQPAATSPLASLALLRLLVARIWCGQGSPDENNAARVLHEPVDGALAGGVPGLAHHQVRAALALAECARWGGTKSLGPGDKALLESLKSLLPDAVVFRCELLGGISRLVATVFPVPDKQIVDMMSGFSHPATWMDGKKAKAGFAINITLTGLPSTTVPCLDCGELVEMLEDAVKGNNLGWKIRASVSLK